MNNTLSLEQSVIKEVASLFGDTDALKQMRSLAKKLKKEKKTKVSAQVAESEFISKEDIMDDLREGLQEVKLANKGKINLQTWEDFKHELHC